MITLELTGSDLGKLVRIARELSELEWLDKLSNFRLLPGNRVAFDQHFYLPTTVQLELSCDDRGDLLIDCSRLADNGVGNFFLQLCFPVFEKFFPDKIVSDKPNAILKKISDRRFLLDLAKCLPIREKIKIEKVETSSGKLTLGISIQ